MFFSILCLKMGTNFQIIFELNTTGHKLLEFTIPHLEADSGDRNRANAIFCKANQHSFHEFLDYHNDYRVSCMFYSTLCLKIDIYFNDVFESYTTKHKPLWFTIPYLVADSTWSNRIVSLDTCILYDERSLGKGSKPNIPWLLVCIGEGRKAWTISWHVSPSHSKNGGRLKSRWREDLFQSKSHPCLVCLVDYYG